MKKSAILALEDGAVFSGISIGVEGISVGEVVFNTAMTGYQEILTDPSYVQQMITFTSPHIGNVGVNPEDEESGHIWATGVILRTLSARYSNWRARRSLESYLAEHRVVGISEIDTRALTIKLREQGALKGCIVAGECDPAFAVAKAQGFEGLAGQDLTPYVTTAQAYSYTPAHQQTLGLVQAKYHVVVYDFGVKRSILNRLIHLGCRITVVPAWMALEGVMALSPDGILFSNGPGDPMACHAIIQEIVKFTQTDIPLFGICLGYQLLALALGAKTVKMKLGHHGANHPVQSLLMRDVLITSQNHGFMVDEQTLPAMVVPSHRSLFDGSLQGFRHIQKPIYGFQGHPEASPGPHDAIGLFKPFIEAMQSYHPQKTTINTVPYYAKAF